MTRVKSVFILKRWESKPVLLHEPRLLYPSTNGVRLPRQTWFENLWPRVPLGSWEAAKVQVWEQIFQDNDMSWKRSSLGPFLGRKFKSGNKFPTVHGLCLKGSTLGTLPSCFDRWYDFYLTGDAPREIPAFPLSPFWSPVMAKGLQMKKSSLFCFVANIPELGSG